MTVRRLHTTFATARATVTTVLLVLLSTTSLVSVVSGQGCTNTCPPVNFGVVVPALCEGDRIDGALRGGINDNRNVDADVDADADVDVQVADVKRIYDVCYPESTTTTTSSSSSSSSFTFDDFRGRPERDETVVTVIANYYTGCNAGRRESGVFAHVAQKYYDLYGPDRVHFVQSIKGGGTCDQWSSIYQSDASDLYPDSAIVPTEMPWSVDDSSYSLRDQFFTSPFGHPAYVVLDGNLEIRHKFIGPCCGYEQYRDCTPDIAKSLDTTLSEYLDVILSDEAFELDVRDETPATVPDDTNDNDNNNDNNNNNNNNNDEFNCEWSEWSACSIRCGPTPGTQVRYKDRRCAEVDLTTSAVPLFEQRPCSADNPSNCNAEDGGLACVPEFGEIWNVREGVVEGLDSPRDVKFHPTPGYHLGKSSEGTAFVTPSNSDEAWIVNGNNHSVSVVTALDTAHQNSLSRRDRGYYHYMINGTAISFNSVSDSGRTRDRDTFNYWAICNDNSNTYAGTKEPNYFMGPTLYDSSPNNRNLVNRLGEQCDVGGDTSTDEPCYFLHSDMLHEAPSCRGIVHDPEVATSYGTVYWAFDATGNREHGQLVRFDFQQPHGPGSMDHSVASVRRYVEVELETADDAKEQAGVHAGMVVHPTRRELFIAVPGKNQILRVGTDSGKFARTAREEYPIFSNRLPSFEYSVWECVDQSVFAENINQPSGMALSSDGERLFVAERGNGKIIAYEVATGAVLYSIQTKFRTIGGMDFAPESGDLYFVDDETNTLNSVQVFTACAQDYARRTNPDYTSALDAARTALGLGASENPFDLIPETCSVDPIVPNATFFDQVHLDTGYASDDPDVQSVMAGMDEAAALLANRTDCGYDSELNFDALLLGGYYCHVCLPEQDQTCDGGGSCQNIMWEGYTCDNEFQIVANTDTDLPGSYLLQTMNGTTLDADELVLKPGITYKFSMMVADEEICLSTLVSSSASGDDLQRDSREDLKLGSASRNSRDSSVVTLGCATNGPLIWTTGDLALADPQIYVDVLGGPVFSIMMGTTLPIEPPILETSSSSASVVAKDGFGMVPTGGLFGILLGFFLLG